MVEINPKGTFVDSEKFHVAAYGRSAYQAWLRREAEIDAKWRAHELPASEICLLRAENYRCMKESGERWAAEKAARGVTKLSAALSLVA